MTTSPYARMVILSLFISFSIAAAKGSTLTDLYASYIAAVTENRIKTEKSSDNPIELKDFRKKWLDRFRSNLVHSNANDPGRMQIMQEMMGLEISLEEYASALKTNKSLIDLADGEQRSYFIMNWAEIAICYSVSDPSKIDVSDVRKKIEAGMLEAGILKESGNFQMLQVLNFLEQSAAFEKRQKSSIKAREYYMLALKCLDEASNEQKKQLDQIMLKNTLHSFSKEWLLSEIAGMHE